MKAKPSTAREESHRALTIGPAATERESICILLVEDNLRDAELISRMLSKAGAGCFTIEAVQRLDAAIDRIGSGGIDAVLMDLTLPDAQGIDSVRRMRSATPNIPLVVLTANDNEELAFQSLNQGAQDYLIKDSVDAQMLVRSISYALERARSERDLAEHRRRLGLLLETVPDRIYFKDAEGRFIQVSPSVAKLLGIDDPQQVLGKTDFHFFTEECARAAFEDEREVMRTGEPIVGKVEKEALKNGSVSWALTTRMPLRDEQGRVVGTFGVTRDITALKAAEAALRASEERYARLLDSVNHFVYTVELNDGEAVSTSYGPGCLAVTGYSPEEFSTDRDLWHRVIHPDDRESVVAGMLDVARDLGFREIVHRLICKDGAIRWVRNKQVPHRDHDGRLISYDGLVSDITERKLANDELIAANTRLTKAHEELMRTQLQLIQAEKLHSAGQLAAGVAHEVKNPLAILLTGLEYLREQPLAADETTRAVLAEMNNAVARANSVISDLLAFSAPADFAFAPHSINEIIERSLHFVRHDLMRAGVKVVKQLAKELPLCGIARDKIEQVFINLFTNACHAMPGGGTLIVTSRERVLRSDETWVNAGDRSGIRFWPNERVVVVEIADTGTGIPPEKLSRVFDPFYTTKKTGVGTGLGLCVVKKIIDLHKGFIKIRNNAERGVTVQLLFKTETKEIK
jgi:PAS domain S-box-containing protein